MMNESLNKVTILDFETTGLRDSAPVSLALIRIEDGKILFAKYYLINPEQEIEYGAYKVHGISQKDVENKPTFADLWDELSPYISGEIVVGHNIKFDAGVIKRMIQRYGLPCKPFRSVCTCQNAKKFISKENISNYKLDTVCDYFGIKMGTHHDARDDTDACRLIFNKLIKLGDLDIKSESLI
jgi:DNA polymerase-3 subunit epsilon